MSDTAARRSGVTARVQALPQQPPHSIEAEQSVLGGLMLNNKAFFDLADKLAASDFYRADHQLIYRGIATLLGDGKACDFVTLSERLRHEGRLDEAGGPEYLASLATDTYSIANLHSYADIVRERSVLRSLIAAGADIGEMGFRPEGRTPQVLIDEAEQKVFAIRERSARGATQYEQVGTVMQRVEARIDMLKNNPNALAGLSTGFSRLDERTNGFHPGDLVIVAARPGMGKCLAWDSELVLDDGSIATIEQLHRARSGRIGTLRDNLKLDRVSPSDYIDDGIKPVFEVTTRLGRRVETTLPHPFLTMDGWKPLAELSVGDCVAVPRQIPVFGDAAMRECEVKLLAYLIGDGGLTGSSPRFTTTNPAIEREFRAEVEEFGHCRIKDYRSDERAPSFTVVSSGGDVARHRAAFAGALQQAVAGCGLPLRAVAAEVGVAPATVTYWQQGRNVPAPAPFRRLCQVLRVEPEALAPSGLEHARKNSPNAMARWLQKLGLNGKGAAAKQIPTPVFKLPRQQLAMFVNRLFATDGWATVLSSGQAQIGYATINETLGRQVQHLLLRFGIISKLRLRWVHYRDARRPSWQLEISSGASLRAFIDEIGIFGKEAAVKRVAKALEGRAAHFNRDLIPSGVWKMIEKAKGSLSWAELARRAGMAASNLHAHRRGISRARLARFAMVLGSPELAALAGSDVYWDRVDSIVAAGAKQVYDLTVPGTHNFVANDVCVHNTSFAMNIAEHVAVEKKQGVAVFSMEMSADQLTERILSSFGRIELGKLRSGRLGDADFDRLTSAHSFLQDAPLYIDETPALTPLDLRARARRLSAQHGIQLIVVDYIQLMQGSGRHENRTNEISEISRSLKGLAKELKVPVIALSQLNRGLESRDDKRPRLSDLRESGGIEQDADLVLFIYRDEMYNDASEAKGKAEIIIGKQRSGPTGKFETAFLGQFTKFDNLADPAFANL